MSNRKGVWAVYYHDYTVQLEAVFPTKLKALEHSVNSSILKVVFLPFGESLQSAVDADYRLRTEASLRNEARCGAKN